MVFQGTGMPLEDGTYHLFLYSPYSAYVSTGDGFIVGNLMSSQSPVQGSFDPACDLMGYSTDNVVIADGKAVIENCSSSGTLTDPDNSVGGILGGMNGGFYVELTDCHSTMDIVSQGKVLGGIVGYAHWTEIKKCSVSGTVNSSGGKTGIGGIAGRANNDVLVEDCSFTGSFTCNNQRSAGIVGNAAGGANLVIRRCFVGSSLLDKNLNVREIVRGATGLDDGTLVTLCESSALPRVDGLAFDSTYKHMYLSNKSAKCIYKVTIE